MAALLAQAADEYLGHNIESFLSSEPGVYVCGVRVTPPEGPVVKYHDAIDSLVTRDSRYSLPQEGEGFNSWFIRRAASWARAAIALGEVPTLDGRKFEFEYDLNAKPPSRNDSDIQFTILDALRRIKRLDPQHFGYVPLDAAGTCLLREIRKDEFDYNLQRLRDRGLVEAWGMGWDDNNNNARITELGLQALDEIERSATQVVDTAAEAIVEESTTEYFVAHEFSPDQIDDLRAAIDSALSDSGLTPYYADNELRQGHIFNDKILERIRTSRFGIYEVSNPNKPNVFLELGAGLALRQPCIIICKKGTQVPADLQGLDRIEYQSYLDLMNQLKDKLRPYIQ